MIDMVRRLLADMFSEARPIDVLILIVDFLVLLAILWLEGPEWWHKRVVRRRKAKVFEFWSRGQKLQTSAPQRHGPETTAS
jgi:hypothetical protein